MNADFCKDCKHFISQVKFQNTTVDLCWKYKTAPDLEPVMIKDDYFTIRTWLKDYLNTYIQDENYGYYENPKDFIPDECIYKFERDLLESNM